MKFTADEFGGYKLQVIINGSRICYEYTAEYPNQIWTTIEPQYPAMMDHSVLTSKHIKKVKRLHEVFRNIMKVIKPNETF